MHSDMSCRNSFTGWILLLLFLVVISPFALLIITGETLTSIFSGGLCTPWLTLGIIISILMVFAFLGMLWFTIIQRVKKLFKPLFRPVIIVLRNIADAIDLSANATNGVKAQISSMASVIQTTLVTSLNNTHLILPVAPAVKSLSQAMHDANSAIPVITNDPIKVLDGNFTTQTVYPLQSLAAGIEALNQSLTSVSYQAQLLENEQRTISAKLRDIANLFELFIS